MAVKNNEQPKKTVKRKKTCLFYKIISFILVIMTVLTLGTVIYHDLFSIFYIIPIIIVASLLVFGIVFVLNKTRLRKCLKVIVTIFSILIITFETLMSFYGTSTLKFISTLTDTGYRVETFDVFVLNTSNYMTLKDLQDKNITYLDNNDEAIKKALTKIQKEIAYEEDYAESIGELTEELEKGKTDAIVFEASYIDVIKDEFESVYEKMRLIHEIDIVDSLETIQSDVDITKDPFIVYISGIDTSGHVASKARSDVNILLAVNPKTNNILMVNTPRDYYITLASKQKKDKLTHAGLYGIEESVNSLSNLYERKIDYYARINFTSFMKIVDALDGIKVNVTKSFCEQNSQRSFKKEDLICLNKGTQTLNGEQALAFARHRKTIGDRARGKNQMLVLEAIINKALSPKLLTKYNSLIAALEGRVTTNMTTNEMYKLIKRQIKKGDAWHFSSISVNGTDASRKAYSTGNYNVSVIEPDLNSILNAQKALDNLYNGETDVLAGVEV